MRISASAASPGRAELAVHGAAQGAGSGPGWSVGCRGRGVMAPDWTTGGICQVMATRGMFSTTDLIGPLAGRVIRLSSSQAYRLVVERQTAQPEDLDGVLDLLDCS